MATGRSRVKERSRFTAEEREGELITIDASVAACTAERCHCHYVIQAPLHYESSRAQTDGQTEKAIT